jgi:oligosaccharyltransferase complex subunit gamma
MQGSEGKLQQITELAMKSKGNVITLDDSTFSYYVVSRPRTYSLVVFMTAAHPKFKCAICKNIDREMQVVAQSYMRETNARGEEPKVFFVRLDYETAQKTFSSYDIASVPVLFHVGPLTAASQDKDSKTHRIAPRDRFQVPAEPTAEALAAFLRERANVSVDIKRSMFWTYVTILFSFGVMAVLVKPLIDSLPLWLTLVRNKSLWALVSAGVYTCSISGLIFDIIRSPQMYYANPQTGQLMFFYPHSGNQFVVEGFVIGFLNLSCAAALIFVACVAPQFKDEQWRMMGMVGGSLAFFVCFRAVRRLYIMKNAWYGSQY